MQGKRRVITSADAFLDPSMAARMAPMVLTPGGMRAEIVGIDLGGVAVEIADYSVPVATRGETLPGRIGVMAPLRHMTSGQVNGVTLAPESLLVFGERSEVAGAVREPLRCGILSIKPQALQNAAHRLGVDIELPGPGEFRAIASLDRVRLSELFHHVLLTVRGGGDVSGTIGGEFAGAVTESLAGDAERGSRIGSRIDYVHVVRVCEEYSTRHSYQNVSLADLCDATGVSERRVRHAFYEMYGMSPTGYLRVAALNEVRHALLNGPHSRDAVSRAATDHGFWHLSRFAGQYRALFGEAPSATLERTRCETATA